LIFLFIKGTNAKVVLWFVVFNFALKSVGDLYIRAFDNGFDVKIVPPATARKAATGNGNDRMADYWPLLNNNACDAVGIAAFAAGYSAQGGK
jgi:hypothetical protein